MCSSWFFLLWRTFRFVWNWRQHSSNPTTSSDLVWRVEEGRSDVMIDARTDVVDELQTMTIVHLTVLSNNRTGSWVTFDQPIWQPLSPELMVNTQTLRRELRVAAQNHDPNAMIQVVKVSFIPNTKKGMKTQKHKQDALMVGETDYGGMFAALLDAHSAAEAVSIGFVL